MTDYYPPAGGPDNAYDWLNALSAETDTQETPFATEVPFDLDGDDAAIPAQMTIALDDLVFLDNVGDQLEEAIEIQEPLDTWDWNRDLLPISVDSTAVERELAEVWRVTTLEPQPEVDPESQAQNGRAMLAMHAAGIEIPGDAQFDLRTSAFHSTLEDPDTQVTSNVWFIPSVFNASREPDPDSGWQSVLLTLEETTLDKPMEPLMIVPFGAVGGLDQAEANAQHIGEALTGRGIEHAFDVMSQLDAQQLGTEMGIDSEAAAPSRDADLDIG